MTRSSSLGGLFFDFQLLLILFVAFRVTLFLAYQPFLIEGAERGVSVGGDRAYHYALTQLADKNLLPFRDWWSEFPPVWYSTTTAAYLVLGRAATYDNWSLVLAMLVIVAEAGTLTLVRKIGMRLHGDATGMALAWIYALLIVPVVFMWWNFDSLLTFFTLAGLWSLLIGKNVESGLWIGLGALTKFISVLLYGALIRFYPVRRAITIISVSLGFFVAVYAVLFAVNRDFALVSLTAQFNKPSYQTMWALLDGNYGTGNFGTIESHLTADGVSDGVSDKNPALIPSIVRLGVALAIGIFVFLRVRRFDQLGVVAFFTLTLLIFYLQSQGWSPQWLTLILPLTLLVMPNRNGALLCVMLSLLAFIEYPYLFVRTGDTGGQILPSSPFFVMWVIVVVTRTFLLISIAISCYQRLLTLPNPELRIER